MNYFLMRIKEEISGYESITPVLFKCGEGVDEWDVAEDVLFNFRAAGEWVDDRNYVEFGNNCVASIWGVINIEKDEYDVLKRYIAVLPQ